jgi:DNA-binding CsgD family transcriptional regulator/PAS domain-containing protein
VLKNRALGALYGAAIEPSRWPDALADLMSAMGGIGARFAMDDPSGQSGGGQSGERLHTAGVFTDEAKRAYLDHYQAIDPRLALLKSLQPGTVVASHQHFDDGYIQRSEFFQNFLAPLGARHSLFCDLSAGRLSATFGIWRSAHRGPFEAEEIALFEAFVPHLQNAARLYHLTSRHLTSRPPQRQPLALTALDNLGQAIAITDPVGQVIYVNRAAARILSRRDGLAIERDRLAAGRSSETARLLALIGRVCQAMPDRAADDPKAGLILVHRRAGRQPYSVSITPLASEAVPDDGVAKAAALVTLGNPDGESERLASALTGLFRLSGAEARLAAALVEGKRLVEIAADSDLRMPTLRTQLRAIFKKTGTTRQAELVRVAKSIP